MNVELLNTISFQDIKKIKEVLMSLIQKKVFILKKKDAEIEFDIGAEFEDKNNDNEESIAVYSRLIPKTDMIVNYENENDGPEIFIKEIVITDKFLNGKHMIVRAGINKTDSMSSWYSTIKSMTDDYYIYKLD